MEEEKLNLVIRWNRIADDAKRKIQERFNIPEYTTLNGWSPAEISPEDKELFELTAQKGFFSILPAKWCKNGGQYIFISR